MRRRTIGALVLITVGLYLGLQGVLALISAPALANSVALIVPLLAASTLLLLAGITLAVHRPHKALS
jgi:lipopolysaccharide export LptBFGC system permease protein LptF